MDGPDHSWHRLSPSERRWLLAWLGILGSAVTLIAGLDIWRHGKHDGSTITALTRLVYRTHSRPGRVAFLATVLSLTYIYIQHILKPRPPSI